MLNVHFLPNNTKTNLQVISTAGISYEYDSPALEIDAMWLPWQRPHTALMCFGTSPVELGKTAALAIFVDELCGQQLPSCIAVASQQSTQ